MREATKNHFQQQHYKLGAEDETDFGCRFEARPIHLGGSRKNTIAYVKLHGQNEETKFNIKCHHFGPSNSSAHGQSPEINEIYCYKLLELIHVGPQVQFIIPKRFTGSKLSLYIVTRWEDDFIPLSGNTEEAVGVDVLVQILLLGTFLFIDDLHSKNCECDEAARMEVARKCLKKWDLLSQIDLAIEQITPEMDQMKQQEIGFKGFNSSSEKLDQYISTIKQNIIKLIGT
ncbi:hypothetical protein GCK72_024212 [Caenorhabditis remanei]|uniref:Uncharacterized protein n=1 Tax=Caenorhabditis remanei TaxID=31234 RepID=A0A6A5FYP0_CAERE|nr:hypothetical protein GCK72_024212 [Caenorhabditis remanei]KAF1747746.1 hypothetical protein GCK72_024212 [Caenorhabditis remanei]